MQLSHFTHAGKQATAQPIIYISTHARILLNTKGLEQLRAGVA